MTTSVILWMIVGLTCLSLVVSILGSIVYISHVTKASREQKKRDRDAKAAAEKREQELFKLFKEKMKEKGIK